VRPPPVIATAFPFIVPLFPRFAHCSESVNRPQAVNTIHLVFIGNLCLPPSSFPAFLPHPLLRKEETSFSFFVACSPLPWLRFMKTLPGPSFQLPTKQRSSPRDPLTSHRLLLYSPSYSFPSVFGSPSPCLASLSSSRERLSFSELGDVGEVSVNLLPCTSPNN